MKPAPPVTRIFKSFTLFFIISDRLGLLDRDGLAVFDLIVHFPEPHPYGVGGAALLADEIRPEELPAELPLGELATGSAAGLADMLHAFFIHKRIINIPYNLCLIQQL